MIHTIWQDIILKEKRRFDGFISTRLDIAHELDNVIELTIILEYYPYVNYPPNVERLYNSSSRKISYYHNLIHRYMNRKRFVV